MNSLPSALPPSANALDQASLSGPEKIALLHELVSQVRQKETALLKRSRRNLDILKPALNKEQGDHLVPCILSTFSVSLVTAGTFLNACMANGRLLIHHAENTVSAISRLADADEELLHHVVAWRCIQAGVPMPWLDMQLAEILAALETFEEQQRDLVVSHIRTANKIMDLSCMLADAKHSLVVAIWAYITNDYTVEFAKNMVDDLIAAIDAGPEKLHQLNQIQCLVEQKLSTISRQIGDFKVSGQMPEGVESASIPEDRRADLVTKTRASLRNHVREIDRYRCSISEFDSAMAGMAGGLPAFVRSLLKFVNVWNREAGQSAKPQ